MYVHDQGIIVLPLQVRREGMGGWLFRVGVQFSKAVINQVRIYTGLHCFVENGQSSYNKYIFNIKI